MIDQPQQPSPAEIATNDIDTLRRAYPAFGREVAEQETETDQTCECGCDCGEIATTTDDAGTDVCQECASYYVDEGGEVVCSREQDETTCRHCDGAIDWGRIQTHAPGRANDRIGRCSCREWRQVDHGGSWRLEEGEELTCTLSIYDVHPAQSSGGGAWPTHDDVEMRATTLADALDEARETLESAAGDCRPEDGYEVGQWIYAQVEAPDCTCEVVGYELTAEDLGVEGRS